jgi:sortase A
MILAGTLATADGVTTLLWQEPISALVAKLRQDRLGGDLRHLEEANPSLAEQRALAGIATERRRIRYLASELERHTGNGGPVGRIVIPRIGVSFVVVKGTDTGDLEGGPGVFSETPLPGSGGTTAIAGHRTTYLAPFRHIDALAPGNRIVLNMPYADFTYTVTGHRVVSPGDVRPAVAELGYSRLVLSACTPLFSAAKRLLVFARLTRTVPVGAARLFPGGQLARPIVTPLHPPAAKQLPPVLESLGPYYVAGSS